MYQSLTDNCPGLLTLFALCFDNEAFKVLCELQLKGVIPISIATFEKGDNDLLKAKKNRSKVEYYFTCTSSLLLYVFKTYGEVNKLTYLDADLFFFSSIKPIFDEMGDKSILIIPHRFSPVNRDNIIFGIYNVAFLTFIRDNHALLCLRWWRERCIEWCFDRLENGRYADQKYLDCWPSLFKGVHILDHIGANVAVWNIDNYKIEVQNDLITVDGNPLIFFHFHGLRILSSSFIYPNLTDNTQKIPLKMLEDIFLPYIQSLLKAESVLNDVIHYKKRAKDVERKVRLQTYKISILYQFRMFLEGKTILCLYGRGHFFIFAPYIQLLSRIYKKVGSFGYWILNSWKPLLNAFKKQIHHD